VELEGQENELFRFTLKYSLMLARIVGAITTAQACLLSELIP
jgi:L-lactate permease